MTERANPADRSQRIRPTSRFKRADSERAAPISDAADLLRIAKLLAAGTGNPVRQARVQALREMLNDPSYVDSHFHAAINILINEEL